MNGFSKMFSVTLCLVFLAGCESKSDMSKSNFAEAIKATIGNDGNVCLTEPGQRWPVDIPDDVVAGNLRYSGTLSPLEALRSVGIVDERPAVVQAVISCERGSHVTKPGIAEPGCSPGMSAPFALHVHRYSLTTKGLQYVRLVRTKRAFETHFSAKPALCVGEKMLLEVKTWESGTGPTSRHAARPVIGQTAIVWYRLEVSGLPDWASNPAVQQAFPILHRIGDGQTSLWLLDRGWGAPDEPELYLH